MSDHTKRIERIVSDIWDPASKVKEEDVDVLFHHLRNSFSDQQSLLQALRADEAKNEAKLEELQHRKELLIDHNLDPEESIS